MSNINPDPFTTRPEIEGTFGVVASTHWIATAVGMAVLEKGGNAFDAAVATAFTLQVLAPAIGYAENGYPLLERANATIATVAAMFREYWPTSAAVYLPNNEVPAAGSLFANKALAATYRRIIKEAESSGGDRVAQIERARLSWR